MKVKTNKFITISYIAIFLFTVIFQLGCRKNSCELPKIGQDFILSDTSKQYVSNYENKTKIVFIDHNGDEQIFNINSWIDDINDYSIGIPCEDDPSSIQVNNGKSQYLEIQISNSNLDDSIFIVISRTIEEVSQEELLIVYGNYRDSANNFEGLLGFKILEYETNSLDSVIVNGKTFYNVLEGSSTEREIKFNRQYGIIYFKNDDGKEFIYERVE